MRNVAPCTKGWSDGNKDGDCCCNCEFQRPLYKHPTNDVWSEAHGSIMHQLAWICALPDPDTYPDVYYMDHKHGMCELHTPRDYEKYSKNSTFEALKR